ALPRPQARRPLVPARAALGRGLGGGPPAARRARGHARERPEVRAALGPQAPRARPELAGPIRMPPSWFFSVKIQCAYSLGDRLRARRKSAFPPTLARAERRRAAARGGGERARQDEPAAHPVRPAPAHSGGGALERKPHSRPAGGIFAEA